MGSITYIVTAIIPANNNQHVHAWGNCKVG